MSRYRHRIRNIIGGSAGNLVEWYDWYVYSAFTLYFAPVFFPDGRPHRAAAERRGDLRGRLPHAADRRLDHGHLFRPQRPQGGADACRSRLMCVGSLLIALTPDLCRDRAAGAGACWCRADAAGAQRRRRIWRQRDLSERDGRAGAARLLFELPVCHPDLRPADRARGAAGPAVHRCREAALEAWGWRIPFAIGAVLAVVVFYIRRRLDRDRELRERARRAARRARAAPTCSATIRRRRCW